jgi:hypothetical protein
MREPGRWKALLSLFLCTTLLTSVFAIAVSVTPAAATHGLEESSIEAAVATSINDDSNQLLDDSVCTTIGGNWNNVDTCTIATSVSIPFNSFPLEIPEGVNVLIGSSGSIDLNFRHLINSGTIVIQNSQDCSDCAGIKAYVGSLTNYGTILVQNGEITNPFRGTKGIYIVNGELANSGSIIISNSGKLSRGIEAKILNTGSVTVQNIGQFSFGLAGDVANTGSIVIENSGECSMVDYGEETGSVLTCAAGLVGSLQNSGTIEVRNSGTGIGLLTTATVVKSGATVNISPGGLMRLHSANFFDTELDSSTLSIESGGQVNLAEGGRLDGPKGVINIETNGVLFVGCGSFFSYDVLNGEVTYEDCDTAIVSVSEVFRSIPEGNSGTTDFVFEVTRPQISATSSVDYATADAFQFSATAGIDYVPTSGTLIFGPGEGTKTITVSVIGDTEVELDEMFDIVLSNCVTCELNPFKKVIHVTIVDDDEVSIQWARQGVVGGHLLLVDSDVIYGLGPDPFNFDKKIVRLDTDGNLLSMHQIDRADTIDIQGYLRGIKMTKDSDGISLYYFGQVAMLDNPDTWWTERSRTHIERFNSVGQRLWERTVGGEGGALGIGLDSGIVYLASLSQDCDTTDTGERSSTIFKLDSQGHLIFTECTEIADESIILSFFSNVDWPRTASVLAVTADETGLYFLDALNRPRGTITKFDTHGKIEWYLKIGEEARQVGGAKQTRIVNGILANSQGLYVWGLIGSSCDIGGNCAFYHQFVRKYDSDGNMIWHRNIGTVNKWFATSLSVDSTGAIYVAGHTTYKPNIVTPDIIDPVNAAVGDYFIPHDLFVVKLSPEGDFIVSHVFSGATTSDKIFGVAGDSSGIYVSGGTTDKLFPKPEDYTGFLLKIGSGTPPPPPPPVVADAGSDQIVLAGDKVYLDGSGSSGTITEYLWNELYPDVILKFDDPVHPTFHAPPVTADSDFYIQLRVKDPAGQLSAPSTVKVTVKPFPHISTRGDFDSSAKLISGHSPTGYNVVGEIPGWNTGSAPEELVIFVHGVQNTPELAADNFVKTKRTLTEENGNDYQFPIIGYSWDSDVIPAPFYGDAIQIAKGNGPKLAQFLLDYKLKNPDTRIRVVTHSLGAQVIFKALESLHHNPEWNAHSFKLESVTTMGAAVDNDVAEKHNVTPRITVDFSRSAFNYDAYGIPIEFQTKYYYNLFSTEDDILEIVYGAFCIPRADCDNALGEVGIQHPENAPSNYYQEDVKVKIGDCGLFCWNSGDNHSGYNGLWDKTTDTFTDDGAMGVVLQLWRIPPIIPEDQDRDNDGIVDELDTMPDVYSNDFRDDDFVLNKDGIRTKGNTSGKILDRGDQLISIHDAAARTPGALNSYEHHGVIVNTMANGGQTPAVVEICEHPNPLTGLTMTTRGTFGPGSLMIGTCGSVGLEVAQGVVRFAFSDGTTIAMATLGEGQSLIFYPETFGFVAGELNPDPVVVTIRGTEVLIGSGETVVVPEELLNKSPAASAGPNQTVNEGSLVTLDGSASSDSDGTIATYSWEQTDGPTVSLSSTSDQKPSFTAPQVSADASLTFRLIVTDNDGAPSNASFVNVLVKDFIVPQSDSIIVLDKIADTRWGGTITVTGTLKDATTGKGISGAIVTFTGSGAVDLPSSVITNSKGAFKVAALSPNSVGNWQVTALYAGDDIHKPTSTSSSYNTLEHRVKLTLSISPSKVASGNTYSVSGTLVDIDANNAAISGRIISFKSSISISSVTTDDNGNYLANGLVAPSKGNYSVKALFAGDPLYGSASSSSVKLTVT